MGGTGYRTGPHPARFPHNIKMFLEEKYLYQIGILMFQVNFGRGKKQLANDWRGGGIKGVILYMFFPY